MNAYSKKFIAGGFAAVILSGSIAASTVPAAADDGSTIAAGILGATAGAMLGAAGASVAPPPPPVVYAGPPRCWMERRPLRPVPDSLAALRNLSRSRLPAAHNALARLSTSVFRELTDIADGLESKQSGFKPNRFRNV